MKYILAMCLTVMMPLIGMALTVASSPAATQAWVESYVSNAINNSAGSMSAASSSSTSNGVTTVSTGDGEYSLTAIFEYPDVLCLVATNCSSLATAQSITNGARWAVNGTGFKGVSLPDIVKTSTNYTCSTFYTPAGSPVTFYSSGTNVAFETWARYVTTSEAKSIRGE